MCGSAYDMRERERERRRQRQHIERTKTGEGIFVGFYAESDFRHLINGYK